MIPGTGCQHWGRLFSKEPSAVEVMLLPFASLECKVPTLGKVPESYHLTEELPLVDSFTSLSDRHDTSCRARAR